MTILNKLQSRAFVRTHYARSAGTYNPANYVLAGWVGESEEAVLRRQIAQAHADKVAARAISQESQKAFTGQYFSKHDLKPGRGIDKASGMLKAQLRTDRWSVMVPDLMPIAGAVFVRTNCKLDGRNFGGSPAPVMTDAADALRRFQPRRLPA